MSGIMQQGYSLGYVLAACANLGVGGEVESWKTVFWAAGKNTVSPTNYHKTPSFKFHSNHFLHSRHLYRRRYHPDVLP